MAATKIIPVRVTQSQFDQIRLNATNQGFKTVSEYMRTHALEYNMRLQLQVQQLDASMKKVHEILTMEKLK